MIEEEDVSPPTLMKVFQGAFMEVSDLSESAFKVKGLQFPFKLNVRIEPDHKFISLVDYNFLHRITHADALKLCNEANQKLGPARFFVAD